MEDLDYLWNYPEIIGELKLKLQFSTTELESVKMEANEQERKYREKVKHLLNLLKLAYQERDEARGQLQKLLNNLMPSSPTEPILPRPISETPLMIAAAKANSSITESNSSSQVESIFDAVTSPDFSSINMADSGSFGGLVNNQPFVQDYSNGLVTPVMTKIDPATDVINGLVKGKTLPEKGKLLQSVMEAGPLLQTLLVAGPLPRWRNPPPLQNFKIPQVSIKGCDSKDSDQKPTPNLNRIVLQKRLSSSSIPQILNGNRQICSAAILNFTSSSASASSSSSGLVGACVSTQFPAGKRQRIQ